MARPMPVLPAVPSTIRTPGLSSPFCSASRMIQSAARSFTDWPGFMNSALARISQPVISLARRRRMRGVFPIASRRLRATSMRRYLRARSGFGEAELDDVGALRAEARLAVAEVEAPELAEALVEAEPADVVPGGLETVRPKLQGVGVVMAEAADAGPLQPG